MSYAYRYTALSYDMPPAASPWVEESLELAVELSPHRRAIVEMMNLRAEAAWTQIQADDHKVDPTISVDLVKRVFACLPPGLPPTDAYVSHAGSVCMDWDEHPSNSLSLIIKAGGQVAYSAYFDGEATFASVDFSGSLGFACDRAIERWVIREQRFCEVN